MTTTAPITRRTNLGYADLAAVDLCVACLIDAGYAADEITTDMLSDGRYAIAFTGPELDDDDFTTTVALVRGVCYAVRHANDEE